MITVYGAPPTRALRVCWMLEELGIRYEIRPVNFQTRFEDEAFMAVSPGGLLPAIRDGDTAFMESCAILEYLGAKYGPTPLAPPPTDRHYPAYISYLHFGEASLSAPLNVAIASRFYAPADQKENWGAQLALDMFVRRSRALLGPLRQADYVAGEGFTAADISCGYALGLSQYLGIEQRLEPPLHDYLARLSQRPAYGRAMAHAQPLH